MGAIRKHRSWTYIATRCYSYVLSATVNTMILASQKTLLEVMQLHYTLK